ncbi:MAG: ATP-binding protein [Bacillota bacterium]
MIDLLNLKQYREGNRLEAKKAQGGLPRSLWETYSSFANSKGGIILLGVEELNDHSLKVCGVSSADKLLAEFWNIINNSKKVSVNLLRDKDVQVHILEDAEVISITVPRADRRDKPVYIDNDIFRGAYRRNGDGDYHCTKSEVQYMLKDQSDIAQDMLILGDIGLDVFDMDTVAKYRLMLRQRKEKHPWVELDNIDFLHKVGAISKSHEDGEFHPTSAGLLMFGYEYEILKEFPNFLLDYQEKFDDKLRWTDRIVSNLGEWSGNIFDFYSKVSWKVTQDLKIPFNLVGMQRVDNSPLEEAIREALANALIHANYYDRQGLVIQKYRDKIVISNPGIFRIDIESAIGGGISDPRNAQIMRMFALVGICERVGSGLYNIFDVWEKSGLAKPMIEEKFNPDRIVLTLMTSCEVDDVDVNVDVNVDVKLSSTENQIYQILKDEPSATMLDIAVIIGKTKKTVERAIHKFKANNLIKRIGSDKDGHWEIRK